MTTVVVTGSAGFIGSHIVEHFLDKTDWRIVGIDSFRHKGDPLRVLDSSGGASKRYEVYSADVGAPLGRLVDRIGEVDYIINCAADSHVDRSLTDPVPFVQNNVNIALYMLEYARIVQPRKFIQISTDEVYGPAPSGTNFVEWSRIVPSNPYSASKAAQEAIAISYWRSYGVPVVITNTMNNFGERQDYEKYVPLLINKIYNNENVTVHGTKEHIGSRYYLHARNHADALLFILRHIDAPSFDESSLPARFNIVGDVEMNNLELAEWIARYMSRRLNYSLVDFHKTRPGHDPRYALDGNKLRSLGWTPPVGFAESLARTIDWTLQHKEWLR